MGWGYIAAPLKKGARVGRIMTGSNHEIYHIYEDGLLEREQNVDRGSKRFLRKFCAVPRTWDARTRGATLDAENEAQGSISLK